MPDQSADKTLAQTLLALAMDLMSSNAPVPTSRIKERHFPGLQSEAARKKLSRARDALESCGLTIGQTRVNGAVAWYVDERCYPSGDVLPTDTKLAGLLAAPLLEDEGFAHRGDLRFALLKLGVSPKSAGTATTVEDNHVLETLRQCLGAHRKVELDYEDASGKRTHRTVAPFGLFDLRGHTYLVCDGDGTMTPEGIRTLRCDRMSHARKTGDTYDIPADFDVNDYRLLPFQLGKPVAECTFRVPAGTSSQLVEITLGEGRIHESEGVTRWEVEASDLDGAASWAIAHELVPESPAELVSGWRRLLRGCLA